MASIPRSDPYVFHGPRGGRLKADTVRRKLVDKVLTPLTERFPPREAGEQSFRDGRLHSFRHYFVSTCANYNPPIAEAMLMEWVGHRDSEMVRHYYHVHAEEAKRRINGLNFLGDAGGWSDGENVSSSLETEETPGRQGPMTTT